MEAAALHIEEAKQRRGEAGGQGEDHQRIPQRFRRYVRLPPFKRPPLAVLQGLGVAGEHDRLTPCQADRALAFREFHELYQRNVNTYASLYNAVLQRDLFLSQSRGYASTLEAALHGNNIPTGVVENLAAIRGREGVISFATLLQPGQAVRILTGPFAEQVGKLIAVDEQARVRIFLEVMGASVNRRATTIAAGAAVLLVIGLDLTLIPLTLCGVG